MKWKIKKELERTLIFWEDDMWDELNRLSQACKNYSLFSIILTWILGYNGYLRKKHLTVETEKYLGSINLRLTGGGIVHLSFRVGEDDNFLWKIEFVRDLIHSDPTLYFSFRI